MSDSSRKLLIVEDDPGLLSQLKWCFEDYEVYTASDRESAIAELRRHEPSVVLQDLGLPPHPEGVQEGLPGEEGERVPVVRAIKRDIAAAPAIVSYAQENDIDVVVMVPL